MQRRQLHAIQKFVNIANFTKTQHKVLRLLSIASSFELKDLLRKALERKLALIRQKTAA